MLSVRIKFILLNVIMLSVVQLNVVAQSSELVSKSVLHLETFQPSLIIYGKFKSLP
jgi:hypothetical protein